MRTYSKKRTANNKGRSSLEARLRLALLADQIPFTEQVKGAQFYGKKQFIADFWITDTPFLVECQGLNWKHSQGASGHQTGTGVARDSVKHLTALENGYITIYCTNARSSDASSPEAVSLRLKALLAKKPSFVFGRDGG